MINVVKKRRLGQNAVEESEFQFWISCEWMFNSVSTLSSVYNKIMSWNYCDYCAKSMQLMQITEICLEIEPGPLCVWLLANCL